MREIGAKFTNRPSTANVRGKKPPLRTIEEIAGDLGVSTGHLSMQLRREGAPKPRLNFSGKDTFKRAAKPVMWFEPKEVKAWYAGL